jgi:23S rRNA (guanosine2251-2'-O)-methyltransferase
MADARSVNRRAERPAAKPPLPPSPSWGALGAQSAARYGCGDGAIVPCRVRAVKNARKHAFRRGAPRRARPGRADRPRPRGGGEHSGIILYGWHTVTAALVNPARRIRRLLATENALRRLADEGIRPPVEPELVRPDVIAARLSADAVHQGLYAETDPLPSPALSDLGVSIVLVLDQITDPHNVGAILRTAAAFAVGAVVTTARHSPEATGVLAKSASGALEWVPIVIVQNLARALAEMKEHGFLVVGLDSEAGADLAATELSAPLALVLGAEGKGLRQGTRAVCDRLVRLDLPGAIKSLNVSNAAALALYVASRAVKA